MNVEQFMYDYTASSEWKQMAKLKWHTNEVMDFAEAFAKQANPVENRVVPKITEVINNKKKNIWKSLNEYTATAKDLTPVRLRTLNLMAENECIICDEILQEIKSNFTA